MRHLLLIVLILPVTVFAQLSDDQQALLEAVQVAFEQAEAWPSYSQSIQETTSLVYTLTTQEWATEVTVREILLEIEDSEASGSVEISQSVLTSEMDSTQETTESADFEFSDGEIEASQPIDENGLSSLIDMDWTLLLENVTAVYDLGVREVRGVPLQRYQLEVDALASLPALNLEMTALIELVGRDEWFNWLVENGTLTLEVTVNLETGQLLRTELFLELPIETDDLVLEYSYEVISNYYEVD